MAEALLLEDVSLDDLLIEEEDGDEAPKPGKAGAQKAVDLEMTPAPRRRGDPMSTASAPARTRCHDDRAAGGECAGARGALPPNHLPAQADTPADAGDARLVEAPARRARAGDQLDLERYARKHQRYTVDWLATLRNDTVVAAVRVFDISAASLAIECSEPFEVGQWLTLVFDQLPQRPSTERHGDPPDHARLRARRRMRGAGAGRRQRRQPPVGRAPRRLIFADPSTPVAAPSR